MIIIVYKQEFIPVNNGRTWTKAEDNYLKTNWTRPNQEIGITLQRSKCAVANRKLILKKRGYKSLSDDNPINSTINTINADSQPILVPIKLEIEVTLKIKSA